MEHCRSFTRVVSPGQKIRCDGRGRHLREVGLEDLHMRAFRVDIPGNNFTRA